MSKSGIFIALYDKETLKLYLNKGIYGFLMPPVYENTNPGGSHYRALGDYACIRDGTYVFFFLKRKIIYGGQVIGSKTDGAFYLNGKYSPLGRIADAELYWDESKRERYKTTGKPGVFIIPKVSGEKCQPYIIRFEDKLGIKGKFITSDQLYFELGKYPYPLPTNTISGMGFCTMTPGEVEIALSLLKESKFQYPFDSAENIELQGEPKPFLPEYGFTNIKEAMARATNEAHLEAMILANPSLLPENIRPGSDDTLCRQVPMSPFKPPQWIDKANICIYSKPYINDGTLPNKIIELKTKPAGRAEIEQVVKYLKWLFMVLKDEATQINIFLCAPLFKKRIEMYIPEEYKNQIRLIKL